MSFFDELINKAGKQANQIYAGAQKQANPRAPQQPPLTDVLGSVLRAVQSAPQHNVAPQMLKPQAQQQWLRRNAPQMLAPEMHHTELPAIAQFFQELPKATNTVGNAVGNFALNGTSKLTNQGLGIIENAGAHVTGNQDLINKTKQHVDSQLLAPGKGLFGAGGIYNSSDGLHNATPQDVLTRAGGTALQSAAERFAPQGAAKVLDSASPAFNKIMTGIMGGLGTGAAYSTGSQLGNTGKVDPTQLAFDTASSGLIGGAIPGAVEVTKNVAPAVKHVAESAAAKHEQTMLHNAAQGSPVIINRLEHINPTNAPIDQALVSQHIKDIQNRKANPVIAMRDETGYLNVLSDPNKIEAYKQLGFDTVPMREVTAGQLRTMKQGGYAKVPGTKGTLGDTTKKQLPQPAASENVLSKFPTRLMEEDRTAPINDALLRNSSHEQLHNNDVLARTAETISKNEDQALSLAKNGESADANAAAMQLLEKYLKEGSYDKATALTDAVMPRFTRQGQGIQILSRWGRLDPAGAVKYAARKVEQHNAKNVVGTTLEDTLASTHNTIKSHANEVASQLEKELQTGKLASGATKNAKTPSKSTKPALTPKTPEQRLADRINAPSTKKLNEPDPIMDMVNTLHKVAKEVLPESAHKTIPRNPMELIGQAIRDKANYKDVYDKAKALVMEKYANNPTALAELEKYFGTEATRTYSASQLNQGVKQGMKGVDLGKIVKQHYTKVDQTGKELEQKLVEQAGLSPEHAHQLAGDIQKRYGELVQQRKDSILKQMFGDKPKAEQTAAFERIITMKNLGALSKDELRPLVAKKLGIPSLSGENAQKISQMAEHIQTLKEGSTERHLAIAEMMDYIGKLTPNGTISNLVSTWKAGLLSGVKTTEGNIVSNFTFASLKKASDPITVAADRAMSLLTGKRSATLTQRGGGSGALEGFKKGAITLKTGVDLRMTADKYEAHAGINFKNPTVQKVLGKAQKVFDFMSAQDQPFYYSHLKNSLYDLAKADGLNKKLKGKELLDHMNATVANPPEAMMERAVAEANKSVLSYDTLASKAIQGMRRGIDSMQGVGEREKQIANAVVDVLAPFVRVPTAFLSRSIDYTPLGIGKTILTQIARKEFDQRSMAKAIGEGLTGTGVIAIGVMLTQNGQLSGDYPTSPKEQARWKAEKITPNSVKLGDKWYSLNYLGPIGMLLGAGKKYDEAVQAGGDTITAVSQSLAGFGQTLLGQSFLQGMSGFVDAAKDPSRYFQNYLNSQVASVVPAASNDLANLSDSNQRQVNNPLDAMMNKVPGARQQLNIKQDVYGNDLEQNPFDAAFNAFKPSVDGTIGNPVIGEVSRLHSVDPSDTSLQVTPTGVGKSVKAEGQNIKLTDKQRYDLQKTVGQATQDAWGKIIDSSAYQTLSDAEKAKKLSDARTAVADLAQRNFLETNGLHQFAKGPTNKLEKGLSNGTLDITSFAKSNSSGSKTGSSTTALSSSLDSSSKDTLTKYDSLTATDRKKFLASSNDAEYKYQLAKYKNDKASGNVSDIQDLSRQKALTKAKIGASVSKDARDLYSMSKAQIYDYITKSPNGNKLARELQSYDQSLLDAGLTSYLKFKTGMAPAAKKASTGRRSSGGRRASTAKARSTGTTATKSSLAALTKASKASTSMTSALNKKVASVKVASVSKRGLPTMKKGSKGITAYKKPSKTNVSMTRKA